MLKLFRKIRHKLLTERKFSKYLIYAFGEIILVMVGILLALQVNNWNENRKLKKQEKQILLNFKKSLEFDLDDLAFRTIVLDRSDASIKVVLEHLENGWPYHDSLDTHFGQSNATPELIINTSVFEMLRSRDLNIIANDSLREALSDFYNYYIAEVKGGNKRYSDVIEYASLNLYDTRFDAFWKTNYEIWKDDWSKVESYMTPINYDALKNDNQYIYHLKSLPNRRIFLVRNHLGKMTDQINVLLALIDDELNNEG